jgi:hypothetical protein
MKRRANIEEELGGLDDSGVSRSGSLALLVERRVIGKSAIAGTGCQEQTDEKDSDAHGPSKHRRTVSSIR